MGNCQAVDNATLLLQHPSGRVDKHYAPLSAAHLMKLHPGHYVALLLTTTVYSSSSSSSSSNANSSHPLRVTRIKLLRPTDTLILGHVYRLLTSHEVMKGILAKKQAKLQQLHKHGKIAEEKQSSSTYDSTSTHPNNTNQVKQERHRSRNSTPSKSRTWQPALKSISESAS